jgi:uncharacterized protein YggT (Ycf19 family)
MQGEILMKLSKGLMITVVSTILALAELVLGFRIILKLFGANPKAPFVNWVYQTSEPLLYPFRDIFPSPKLSGLFVLEFSALFALLVYSLLAYAITQLISKINSKTQS